MTNAAAIYARYSTEEQDPRSIEDQIRRCTEFARARGLKIVATFSDAATSGAHTDRPQLRALIAAATAGRRTFGAVLVDDLSRLSRDIGGTWRILDELAGAGVVVIDVRTGMASDDPSARMVFGASSLVNDTFLQMVRYQTHRGLQGRALAGFATGGTAFGYRTLPEPSPADPERPRRVWAIDEAEAAIVLRMAELFLQGHGYRSIADALNRDGIEAPRNGGRGGKHGSGWSHMTVRAILLNERYVGRWAWNTHRWTRVPGKRARRRVARPASEHVVREMPELSIFSPETWAKIRARMRGRRDGLEQPRPRNRQVYLVSGLLRCSSCGGPMSISGSKRKAGVRYVSFGCTANHSRGSAVCDNAATISERKITSALIGALREVLDDSDLHDRFARAFERRMEERKRRDAGSSSDIERRLEAARRRVANATRLLVEDPDDEAIRDQRASDVAEVRRLVAELAGASRPAAKTAPDRARLRAGVEKLFSAIAAGPERGRAALTGVLTPLTVEKRGTVTEVTGAIDLGRLAAVSGCGSSGGASVPEPETELRLPLRFAA